MNFKKTTSKQTEKKAKKAIKHKKRRLSVLDRIVIVFLTIALLCGAGGLSVIGYIIATTDTDNLISQMNNTEPSTFLDQNGEEFAELGLESRENVSYQQVPQSVIDAFLAIEDSRFYKHNGFDLPRFISSALTNLKSGSLAQGGSTLTMQTIDNFFIKKQEQELEEQGIQQNTLQKIESKMREIYMSMRIEQELSKAEIMERYLNQINFGNKARGIQRGAQYFFGKDVEDLNLSEAAYLAGCINAPNTFNPYNGYSSSGIGIGNFSKLTTVISTYSQLSSDGYTQESWNAFAQALDRAKRLAEKESESQATYADGLATLQAAYEGLAKSDASADLARLQQSVNMYATFTNNAGSSFSDESWQTYAIASEEANQLVVDNSTNQEAVTAALKKLNHAFTALSPIKFNYYEAATKRRDETLYMMKYHGYISQTEYELAKSTQLAFQVVGESASAQDPYDNYLKAVTKEVMELTGLDPATTPMVVHTYLDKEAQLAANEAAEGKVVSLDTNKNYQIATSVIDNKTGGIIAMIPGRSDYESEFYRNRADDQERMPGSSVKPIFDYAYALDHLGYCTSRVYNDKKMTVDGTVIRNSDGKYYGKVSMERALAQSLNTPAMKTMEDILNRGYEQDMKEYLQKLGVSEEQADQFNNRYALGGSLSTSPRQMAGAFSALANQGIVKETHYVRSIEFKDGKKDPITVTPKETQAMSPQAAYMTSELLYKAVHGKYQGWNLMGRLGWSIPVYGKTGTSDWASDGLDRGIPETAMRDEWMINYTSEYTIATWSGFDQEVADGNNYVTEQLLLENIPGWINKHILETISKNPQKIQNPGGIASYGGGMIKQEFLKDAAKNNPMTEANQTQEMDKLQALYDQVKGYQAADYTAESFAAFQSVLEEVARMLDEDTASDDEVYAAITKLQNAVNNLVKTVHKDTLLSVINQAAALNPNEYTADSYRFLASVVEEARKIYQNPNASQAEINSAVNQVQNAIQALVKKSSQASKGALANAINIARRKAAEWSVSDPNRANRLRQLIASAQSVYNNPNASQAEVDAQTNALYAAM